MTNVVALDLDGVLNEFSYSMGGHVGPWAKHECVYQLDRIIVTAEAAVVVSSTWRNLVHNGDMTISGFRALLRSHGMRESGFVVGVTGPGPLRDRGQQVREWWRAHPRYERLVAIDDMKLGYDAWGIKLVQTDGRVGLTSHDADRAIAILTGRESGNNHQD